MVQFRFNLVEVVGVVPLAETPRSDIINVVLCLQATLTFNAVRQSVLLSQNGSHPQLRPRRPLSTNKKYPTQGVLLFVVEVVGRRTGTSHRPSKPIILADFRLFFDVFAWFSICF